MIVVNDEQPEKAEYSISVTPLGISIFFKDEQPEKTACPILVTPSGMAYVVIPAGAKARSTPSSPIKQRLSADAYLP